MTLITKERAEQAITEYNTVYEAGGEMDYPMWAAAILKSCAEAEQLTERVVELGGVNVE